MPCRFREQTKRVNVREDANLVSVELILAALFAFGGGGFKPIHHFGFDGVAVGMLLALEKFPFVPVEIIVDAVKLAPEIILLAAKNSGEVGFEFVAENRAKVVGPRGKIRGRPGEMRRIGFGFSEREVFRKRWIGLAVSQGDGEAMEGPMLVGCLDFAADQNEKRKVPGRHRHALDTPANAAGKLCVPSAFGRFVGGRTWSSFERSEDNSIERSDGAEASFGEPKCQRTAWESFGGGIADGRLPG